MNIQDILGIRLPIVQAPMAGVQNHALAVAVSNAGGLGSLPCAMLSPDALRSELAALTEKTDQPYNLNFFCHRPPSVDDEREAQWQRVLAPYYREFGIDLSASVSQPARMPFSEAVADIIEPFQPPVVSFHFGLPAKALVDRVHSWGSTILSTATTVDEALWLEANGADVVIAQGLEAGGHRGFFLSKDLSTQLGTLALVPQLVDAVNIPVIAAGGIVDAKTVKAVQALGAAGAQVGTAYLLCTEATTSTVHRSALESADAQHTALTNIFSGGAARGIINRVMRELGPICDGAPPFPLASATIAPLRAHAESLGSGDLSPLWAGQNASACKAISAARMTLELADAG